MPNFYGKYKPYRAASTESLTTIHDDGTRMSQTIGSTNEQVVAPRPHARAYNDPHVRMTSRTSVVHVSAFVSN